MEISNEIYIKHIRDSIYRIENYVEGVTKEEFFEDDNEMMRAAVVRELEVIGEAAKNVEKNYTQEHNELPWRDMIDTRNKIIHDYMSVDYELVWDIISKDLSKLKKQAEDIVGLV